MATAVAKAAAYQQPKVDEVFKSIPNEAYTKSSRKAVSTLVFSVLFVALGYAFLTATPWFFTPIGWLMVGTAATGLFVIGHDCGKNAFFQLEFTNKLVGTICFLPLLLPFESWRVHYHLQHTVPTWVKNRKTVLKTIFNPLRWFSGARHYFDMALFQGPANLRVRLSVLYVYAFALIFFPAMYNLLGAWGLIKYWVGPWVILRCWQYALRESRVEVEWKEKKEDDSPVDVSLVYHRFPRILEFMSNDFNLQLSQYLGHSKAPEKSIPCYNLSLAHRALAKSGNMVKDSFYYESSYRKLTPEEKAAQKAAAVAEAVSPSAIRNRRRQREADAAVAPDAAGAGPQTGGKRRLTAAEFEALPFLQRVNWLHVYILSVVPLMGVYGLFTWSFNVKTALLSLVWYYMTGLGITAGYHRLWAHRAYKASLLVRLTLLICGTGAVEGSVRWWSRGHRAHHRYTDTDKDPYDATKGLWWSHMGWMLMKENPGHYGYADMSDLTADPMVSFQHKYYLYLAPLVSIGIPALVASMWGDVYGGVFIAGFVRLCFVQQATFCINSIAHALGDQGYADNHTPRDSIITAIITMGEGYHNFHHEFPQDYRNGIRFYHYDPTKWVVATLAFFGLTWDLHRFPENEIQKGQVQILEKQVLERKQNISYGTPVDELPAWSMAEVARRVADEQRKLVVVDSLVHDVADFSRHHPGGEKLILSYVGKDATSAFNGGVYNHSNAGHNLLTSLRVARVVE